MSTGLRAVWRDGLALQLGHRVSEVRLGGFSNLRPVRDPLNAHGSRVQVASLLDLAG
jgi:hypothetical protein